MMVAAFLISGLGGVGLLAVGVRELRRRRREAEWRIILNASRRWSATATMALVAGPVAAPVVTVDPTGDVLDHIAPGPGSLTTLAEVGEGRLITITRDDLVDPEVAQWFVDALDRPVHIPGRDEARVVDEGGVLTRFHIAMEPAMRTARLWSIRGHADHGPTASRWADLDRFLVEPDYAAADLAEARLVS